MDIVGSLDFASQVGGSDELIDFSQYHTAGLYGPLFYCPDRLILVCYISNRLWLCCIRIE